MRYLTFALAKGRLAKETLKLLEKIGITCEEINDPKTRKLIFFFFQNPAMFPHMLNMELLTSVLWEEILSLRKVVTFMRFLTLDSENVKCAYADLHLQRSF